MSSEQQNGHSQPFTEQMRQAAIAPELAARRQWCGYIGVPKPEDPGRFGKEPHQTAAPHCLASDTNPKHWATLARTQEVVAQGKLEGLLYTVSGNPDDVSSMDLDHVLDPQTGGVRPEFAELVAIVKRAGRLEYSPSEIGLRWWGWGTLPEGVQVNFDFGDHRKVEFYGPGHPHFASCTGRPYGDTPPALGDRAAAEAVLREAHAWTVAAHAKHSGREQPHPDEPHAPHRMSVRDWLLFATIARSKDNAKFLPLWNANDMRNGGDVSRGDAKLMRMLAYWLGKDAARMDTWMRASSRMRPKWDERHYANGQTYGERLIQEAIGWTFDTYSGEEADIELPPLRVLTDLEAQRLKLPPSLIGDILPQQSLALLIGLWGTWKSFVALSMALSIATHTAWLGQATAGGAVVYICTEGEASIGARISAWKQYYGVPLDQQTEFLLIPDVVNVMDTAELERLIDEIYARGIWPALIVLDTVAWAMGGEEENSNAVATRLTMAMRVLRQRYTCTVLGVHHEGSDPTRGARGATAFEGNVDVVIETVLGTGVGQSDLLPGMPLFLKNRKMKPQPKFATFPVTTEPVYGEFEGEAFTSLALRQGDPPAHGKGDPLAGTRRRTLVVLQSVAAHHPDGVTYTDWRKQAMELVGISRDTFRRIVNELEDGGYVRNDPDTQRYYVGGDDERVVGHG